MVTGYAEHVRQLQLSYYTNVLAFAILYYDYLITFSLEVERFWTFSLPSWASFFFFLNRYLVLLGHLPVLVEVWVVKATFEDKFKICSHLQSYHQYFAVVVQTIAGVMLIMRTYALYGYDKRVLFGLLGIAVTVIAVGCWGILSGKSAVSDEIFDTAMYPGCNAAVPRDTALHLAIAWSGVIVFDTTVFALTLIKSLQLFHTARRNILTVLVRDGAMYFGIMSVFNLINAVSFVCGAPHIRGLPTTLNNVICSTMLSRLYLNLRDPKLDIQSTRATTTRSDFPFVTSVIDDRTLNPRYTEPGFTYDGAANGTQLPAEFELETRGRWPSHENDGIHVT